MQEQERITLEQAIQKIWNEQIVPLCKGFDEDDRLEAKYQIDQEPRVTIHKANKRKPGPRLKVTFDDGTCLEQGVNGVSATDILLAVINKVDIETVRQHEISASGVGLIQNNLDYASKGLKPAGGLWVITKTPTLEKKVQIDKIKEIFPEAIIEVELVE